MLYPDWYHSGLSLKCRWKLLRGYACALVCALPVPTRLQEKIRSLGRLLEGGEGGLLDEAKLRGITSTGVPDTAGLRPILWRYLLQCVPWFLEDSALCAMSIAAMLRDVFCFPFKMVALCSPVGTFTISEVFSSQSTCFCVANPTLATSGSAKPLMFVFDIFGMRWKA